MSNQNILVEKHETKYDFERGAVISMPTKEATILFHDINRLLSLLDVLDHGSVLQGEETEDQRAYFRVNDFLAVLQLGLKIEPENK